MKGGMCTAHDDVERGGKRTLSNWSEGTRK